MQLGTFSESNLQPIGWRFSFAEERFMHRWAFGLAFAFLCFALSGCSWRGGDVSGTVKIGGKPATSGTVIIEDARGRTAIGTIKKDGTYTVIGPPKGTCKVMLRRSQPLDEGGSGLPDPNKTSEPAFPIPAKYASAKSTDIEITVTSSAQTFDIERDDKLDFSPPSSGLPAGTAGGKGPAAGGGAKPPGSGKPAGPGMPSGGGMPKK